MSQTNQFNDFIAFAGHAKRSEAIGAFFRERRIAVGLSILEVELLLETSTPGTVERYESGELSIPLDDIFALTNLLNIPPESVMAFIQNVFSSHHDRNQ